MNVLVVGHLLCRAALQQDDAVSAPADGAVSIGGVATFAGFDGFAQTGDLTITCNAPTADTPRPVFGSAPTCTATICTDTVSAPTDGTVSTDNNNHGGVATFACNHLH